MSATKVLAIDPGCEQSAWVRFDGARILGHAIEPNHLVLSMLRETDAYEAVALEHIESFGMAVGKEVFETVFWTGRFFEAASEVWRELERIPRKAVKLHLCGSVRAQDANVRVALIDLFGGSVIAKGSKKAPGPLFGLKSHEWAALAVAVTWWNTVRPVEVDVPVTPRNVEL